MKLFPPIQTADRRPGIQAFTLSEIMIVVVIFTFIVLAIVGVQIVALRVYTLGATKLSATTDARESLNVMRDAVRSTKICYVGNYTNGGTGFVRVPVGSLQMGNALEVSTTNTTTTNYIVFYLDNSQPTNILYSISNNVAGTRTVMAKYVTNYYCFISEDYRGVTNVNYLNNPVIHIIMDFDQWEFPLGFVGTNALNAYDFYHITTRIMRRAKE